MRVVGGLRTGPRSAYRWGGGGLRAAGGLRAVAGAGGLRAVAGAGRMGLEPRCLDASETFWHDARVGLDVFAVSICLQGGCHE